ncbi:MAG: DUF6011 domain-containing protein [Planctomycetaceae bacterium]
MNEHTQSPRVRPLPGQLDLFGGLPVAYCRRCGRRLRSPAAIERGLGQTCERITDGAIEPRRHCVKCEAVVAAESIGCERCGNGIVTSRFRTRTSYHRRQADHE